MTDAETICGIQTLLRDAGYYHGAIDGDFGAKSRAALDALLLSAREPVAASPPAGAQILAGDGTWPWRAFVDGLDIVVTNARATCFGGADDPQDSGETASGISTKDNPDLAAVSLPMDGRMFHGLSPAEHAALDGSPLPRVPWETKVMVTSGGVSHIFPVIDLGPGKRTGNAIDCTKAAARKFKPNATTRDFEMRCDLRIIGGAQFVKA